MRIISGIYKGKKIIEPRDILTRPLKDLTKESIFNIIKHSNLFNTNIVNSDVLDLFAGTGSFGLECLSRGASSVIFCENHKNAILVLEKNISNLECGRKSKIEKKNIFDENFLPSIKNKFDIIFLDPPYKNVDFIILIKKIITLNLLKKDGVFIIHRHKKTRDVFPEKFKLLKEAEYGISKIIFGY